MIASLKGSLAQKGSGYIIVDVHGVGYQVFVPLSSFYQLPEEGAQVSLVIYTNVREDEISLYGFLHGYEKDLFMLLLLVSGVGPKMALNILSYKSVPELVSAIQGGKTNELQSIPGVGKKIAERLVIELREKVGKLNIEHLPELKVGEGEKRKVQDVMEALLQLGYKRQEAERMMNSTRVDRSATVEDMLKSVLKVQ
jgi:Holliday junction DNA helicase RuvA